MSYLERLRNRQSGIKSTEKNTQPYEMEPLEPLKVPSRGFRGAPHRGTQLFFETPSLKRSLQDIPEIPRSGTPQPVEAWTPSGHPLLVTAYSEEHAAAIRRMNPPPTGDRHKTFLTNQKVINDETKIDAADQQEAYEERAAIMEYDGGLTMQEAEQKAGTCYHCRRWHGTRSGKGYCVLNGLAPPIQRIANESCEQFTRESRP